MVALADDDAPQSGEALNALPCFKDVSPEDCDLIFQSLTPLALRRGSTLMLNREMPTCGAFVWRGVYRIVLAPAPTRPVALDVVRRGEFFGFFQNFGRWGDALRLECRESGRLLVMQTASFAGLRRAVPQLSEVALAAAAQRAVDHGNRIFELATLNARERVIAELLRLARGGAWSGRACYLRPSPTHQDLAEHVGAAREVVTRSLKQLQTEGLIEVERGYCKIIDVDRLLAMDEKATGRRMFDPTVYGGSALVGGLAAGVHWLLPILSMSS